MTTARTYSIALLALALLGSGCGTDSATPVLLGSLGSQTNTPTAPLPFAWPPTRGEVYPDVQLLNQRGEAVHLSSFKGKILLVDLVGMT